jgi:hypothetical protein
MSIRITAGGTTKADGSLLFANAHYTINEAEWSFWTNSDYETKTRQPLHVFARAAQRASPSGIG